MTDALNAGLRGCHVLLVEDEYMIADDLAEALLDEGAEVLGPHGWVEEALSVVRSGGRPDAALLDVNLHGTMVWPLLDVLLAAGVPVVLATGYDAGTIPRAYAHVPRCEKPLAPSKLVAALSRSIAASR